MVGLAFNTHPRLEPLDLKAANKFSLRTSAIGKEDANLLQSLDLDEERMDDIPGQLKAATKRGDVAEIRQLRPRQAQPRVPEAVARKLTELKHGREWLINGERD